MQLNTARATRFAALALASLAACLAPLSSLPTSSADVRVSDQPASEGRPVTPAGELIVDAATHQPAVGALPVDLVRSPDRGGAGGRGRYLVAVNSGYGVQFSAATNKAQQSLAVIDTLARPAPAVVQNVYFPTPQSANVGLVFAPQADADGAFRMYVSGGFENKIWLFRFTPGARRPVSPASPGPDTQVKAPSIDLAPLAAAKTSPRQNDGRAPVYPAGLAISADGDTLFAADNLDDSLAVISNLRGDQPQPARVELAREGRRVALLPYGVAYLQPRAGGKSSPKVYVSCWNDESVAVVETGGRGLARRIAVGSHPTALIFNAERTRLYVANSNADTVSVIDTAADAEIERVNVRLSEDSLTGHTPESLALSEDGATLYVANAHSNALAAVALSPRARGKVAGAEGGGEEGERFEGRGARERAGSRSRVRGFIPTGQYPSAVAVVGATIFVGNGKGTGFANSSLVVDDSGRVPNAPNDRFPVGAGRGMKLGGEYSPAIVAGNLSAIREPDPPALAAYTRQVMRNDGLISAPRARLFAGRSPIRHVVYVIKENRTYDQLFGDLARAGDGAVADGDPSLAIFGAGEAARSPLGAPQDVTPNQRALALRFGLLDRFFVNAEASADGHNWSTAAISTDYTDKAFRWNYSDRGRGYDFEGFNRLPDLRPTKDVPPVLALPATAEDLANFTRRFIPYLNGGRDAAEPASLYLWDAAARAGLSYRNYGEFVGTESEDFVRAVNADKRRSYPDISPTAYSVPTKRALEGHHSTTYRNFDQFTPDSMTTDSYRAARESGARDGALVSRWNADARFRGTSRAGEWLAEFRGFVEDLNAGRGDRMPRLSILRLPNDHTEALTVGVPTPQFYVAENDYAVGLIAEAVSSSPYWRDTAIFVVEDDAQDGPDHVDAHRAPALVVSAYNRPGALVHAYHSTVSLIRTIELLLGLPPMNQLDAAASPLDIFQSRADLRPFKAQLPSVAPHNLINAPPRDAAARYWAGRTGEQNLAQADQADAQTLNAAIWFTVRGGACPPPRAARLGVVDSMLTPTGGENDGDERAQLPVKRR
ncbi:MAG TPA: bifunctional YncE family protein/alkaline phosphatase family protein [Pyrinomonadaceae bacterium]|jgi:YVTN family beta-propeller protein